MTCHVWSVMDHPTLKNRIKKHPIFLAEILMLAGLLLALITLLASLPILYLVFFSVGHVMIIAGLFFYFRAVWKDLKKHKVL